MASLLLMRGGNNANDYKACARKLGNRLPSQITLIAFAGRQAASAAMTYNNTRFVHHKTGKSVA